MKTKMTTRKRIWLWCLVAAIVLTMGLSFTAHAGSLASWNERSSGTSEILLGVAYGGGMFVAVGTSGEIITSPDGVAWTKQTSGTTNNLTDIACGNGTFVTVGISGTILTSTDGANWTTRVSGTKYDFFAVSYINGIFMAVGDNGTVVTSSDGINWDMPGSIASQPLAGIAFGNGVYVAVGDNGTIVTSSDSINWTPAASGTTEHFFDITFYNGTFVAVGDTGTIVTSSDGINWTLRYSGTTVSINGISSCGGLVAAGWKDLILTSSDGMTWTDRTSTFKYDFMDIAYGNGTFVAVGHYGGVYQSDVLTPAAPSGLTYVLNAGDSVFLNWADNSNDETGFKVEMKTGSGSYAQAATSPMDWPKKTIPGLVPGETYYFRVCSYNDYGDSLYSSEVQVTMPASISPPSASAPAAPTGLKVNAVFATEVELQWTDNSGNESFFEIERMTPGGSFAKVDRTGQDETKFTDMGLTTGTTYSYRVRACNSSGNSSYSNVVQATPQASGGTPQPPAGTPVAPSGLAAVAVSNTEVELSWTDNSGNEDGFLIERKQGDENYIEIDIVGPDVTVYIDGSIQAGSTYRYRVRAVNGSGNSAYSNEAVIEMSSGNVPGQPLEVLDGASSWAVPELEKAMQDGLTTDKVLSNYQEDITREEFCELVLKLYEKLTGQAAQPVIPNPFNDTGNPEILKAFNLGIVKGVAADRFAPQNNITRQEICVMLYRTLVEAVPGLDTDTSGVASFADEEDIAGWAIKEVRFANKHQVMKGIGGNRIGPLGNTTREQAIVLVKRTYENFK